MTESVREIIRSLRASPIFALAVLVTFGLAGLNGLMVLLMQLQPGFLGMAHFTEPSHRLHDFTFSLLFVPTTVGMLTQLRRPLKSVAGMVMALIPWIGLALTAVLTFVLANNTRVLGAQWVGVAASTLIATILHPTWRDFFRSFRVSRINWVMLVLVVVAALPLLAFASTNIRLQGTVTDDHALLGHYGFMAAFGFTVIGVGLLASLRPDGWRPTAWVAGLLPALLSLASLVYSDISSSLGPSWALAAIVWGIVFIAVAELTKNAVIPKQLGLGGERLKGDTRVTSDHESSTSTPRWLNVFGAIALVVVVLWMGNVLVTFATGGGPGGSGLHSGGSNTSSSDAASSESDREGNTPPIDGAHELAITADAMMFMLPFGRERIELTVGQPVNVALTSADILHDLTVNEIDFYLSADRGETVIGGLVFDEPGTYIGYCSVQGHREAGMELEIVVTASG